LNLKNPVGISVRPELASPQVKGCEGLGLCYWQCQVETAKGCLDFGKSSEEEGFVERLGFGFGVEFGV
jgi:hypothetical protein